MDEAWEAKVDQVPVQWCWHYDEKECRHWLWCEVDGLMVQSPWNVVYLRPKDCKKHLRKTGEALSPGWWLTDGVTYVVTDNEEAWPREAPVQHLLWAITVRKLSELRGQAKSPTPVPAG